MTGVVVSLEGTEEDLVDLEAAEAVMASEAEMVVAHPDQDLAMILVIICFQASAILVFHLKINFLNVQTH